jgi:hypothetical protein
MHVAIPRIWVVLGNVKLEFGRKEIDAEGVSVKPEEGRATGRNLL